MKEFIQFIREQGVVGLAIGFILGGAVSKVVSSIVGDIINPLIGAIFGSTSGLAYITLGPVQIGNFIAVLIDFIIVAAVVFFIFKKLNLEQMDAKKEA